MHRDDIYFLMSILQLYESIYIRLLRRLLSFFFIITATVLILYFINYIDKSILNFLLGICSIFYCLFMLSIKPAEKRFLKYSKLYEKNEQYTNDELFYKTLEIDKANEEERYLFLTFTNIKQYLLNRTIIKESKTPINLTIKDKLLLKITGQNIN